MKAITVTNREIRVNGYAVGYVPSLGFEYTELYYEPELGNNFKFMIQQGETYKVNLNNTEIAQCFEFTSTYVPDTVQSIDEPEITLDDTEVYVVDSAGSGFQAKPRFLVQPNEIEISYAAAMSRQIQSWHYPRMKWESSTSEFVGVDNGDKRCIAYMQTFNFGDQFDLVWKALAAISTAGIALPAEVTAAIDAVKTIKSRYPV